MFLTLSIAVLLFSGCDKVGTNNSTEKEGLIILEKTEWTNQWVENTHDTVLPRLLLIGDSHVQQYYDYVKRELNGKFVFGRFTTSKCLGNLFLVKEIKTFLEEYPNDVTVINNGLHGPDYPDRVYADGLPVLFRIFSEVAPNAKVIWANTTPRRNPRNLAELLPINEHIKARNAAAKAYMKKHNIPIVDLWSLGLNHPEYYSDDGIHFNEAGKQAEAKLVAKAVKETQTK
jgi:hypothetical protein